MKRFHLHVLAVLFTASLAFGIPIEGEVINTQSRPAGVGIFRRGSEGQSIGSNIGGDYYEGARLDEIYTIKTASAGTSFSTAGTSPLAAGGVAWLALYNPPCAGTTCFNLEIIQVFVAGISGTPGVGGTVYNYNCQQVITAVQNATPVGSFSATRSGVGQGFTQTALTGSSALKELGFSPYAPFAAAFASTSLPPPVSTDVVNGRFIVPPGCLFAVQPAAAGTTHVGIGAITYRQAVP